MVAYETRKAQKLVYPGITLTLFSDSIRNEVNSQSDFERLNSFQLKKPLWILFKPCSFNIALFAQIEESPLLRELIGKG